MSFISFFYIYSFTFCYKKRVAEKCGYLNQFFEYSDYYYSNGTVFNDKNEKLDYDCILNNFILYRDTVDDYLKKGDLTNYYPYLFF